jgi:hypothetical protein
MREIQISNLLYLGEVKFMAISAGASIDSYFI